MLQYWLDSFHMIPYLLYYYNRHTEYTSEDDGSKRVRVRFNLEGQQGKAFVFAEVSKSMPSGEFVYGKDIPSFQVVKCVVLSSFKL
jgi:hypothetical protein